MAYLNKVMLIGNIGKEPEIKSTGSGRKVCSFSIATSRRYRDNNGEQKEQTDWHNIVIWGKLCDVVESLGVHKGMSLYVEGTLTNRSWSDQNGQKRYTTEINCDNFQLLSQRGQSNGNPYSSNRNHPAEKQSGFANEDGYISNSAEEDLPF